MRKGLRGAEWRFRGLPPFSSERGERVLWRGKPSLRAFWPLYLCGILAVLCSLPWPWLLLATIPFLLLTCFLARALRTATEYIVTDRKVRREFRLWVGRVREVRLNQRVEVTVSQDAVQRILGIGDVCVFTPYSLGGVRLWGLEECEKVHRLVSGH